MESYFNCSYITSLGLFGFVLVGLVFWGWFVFFNAMYYFEVFFRVNVRNITLNSLAPSV